MDLLIIAPNDYEALIKKGVICQYENFREGGYFKNVISLFPFNRKTITTKIDDNKFFYQYGWQSSFNILNKLKITKILGAIGIIFKLIFIFPFIIKKYNIKIIRATDPYLMGLIGLFYSKLFKIPFVVSIHSDYDKGEELGGQTFKLFGSRKTAKKLENFVYKHYDLILPIRDYLKQKILKEFPVSENKIKLFPHGLDLKEFENMEYIDIYKKFNIDKKIKIISFIGRLSKENYVYDLISITKELMKSRSDFIVLVLGDGAEYQNIQEMIEKENIEIFLRLVGFQSKKVVVNTRKESFISLSLMGGFSLIEACAGARPVISYNVEWHYELVKNDETGYLIKENDINKVSEKINYLLNNPTLANKFGLAGKDLVFKNNNLENTIKKKQNIFKNILEETK